MSVAQAKAAICCGKASQVIRDVEDLTLRKIIKDDDQLLELANLADRFADKFAKVALRASDDNG